MGRPFLHRVLKFTPGFHTAADVFDPLAGNVLDMLLATDHEGGGPNRVASALGVVAVRLAAAEVWEVETAHEFQLALAESRGLRPSGFAIVFHLIVYIP